MRVKTRSLIFIIISISLLFLLFIVFNKEKGSKGEEAGMVHSHLNPFLSVQQKNDGIYILAALENQSNHTVTLSFDSSKMFDIIVTDSVGKEMFRHSKGKAYDKEKMEVQIDPEASYLWKAKWNLSASDRKAGTYQVKAVFFPSKVQPSLLKNDSLTVSENVTFQPGGRDLKNNSFRNIHFTGSNGKYTISGEARVFEASFAYLVTDGHEVFVEGHDQTTEGAPAWAPFSFEITIPEEDLPINGTLMLELFYYSPKDGEKTDILAVPLESFQ